MLSLWEKSRLDLEEMFWEEKIHFQHIIVHFERIFVRNERIKFKLFELVDI